MQSLPRVGESVELGVLCGFLSSLSVSGLPSDFDVLEVVAAWERVAAAVQAAQLVAVGELAARPEVLGADDDPRVVALRADRAPAGTTTRGWLGEEVAARLGEAPWSGGRIARAAVAAPVRFPEVFAAHRAGRVSSAKLHTVVAGCARLDDGQANQVDARVAARASHLTPARLRQAVKRAVLRVDPATATDRRERALGDRCVRITPTDDGMAELWALLPADSATALGTALDDHARAARSAGDERTLDQLRADALTSQITTQVEIGVLVPASVLLGVSDDPATLSGHGPIDADLARSLATDATWRRILTDPHDATCLSTGTSTYRPGAVMARHVATRDQTCRYPGCDHPARRCDLDHTTPHPAGPTSPENLGTLCRRHHLLKHDHTGNGAPRLHQLTPGHFIWTLPAGHHHATQPARLHEVDDPLATSWPRTGQRPPRVDLRLIGWSLAGYHHTHRQSA